MIWTQNRNLAKAQQQPKAFTVHLADLHDGGDPVRDRYDSGELLNYFTSAAHGGSCEITEVETKCVCQHTVCRLHMCDTKGMQAALNELNRHGFKGKFYPQTKLKKVVNPLSLLNTPWSHIKLT